MEEFQDDLPGYRGHHEQNMALSGIGYARAMRRKQIFIATSSVGPGATNMVTASAVALSNRLPILLLRGDTYANRFPDPVLQQVENFYSPTDTQNNAFKSVSKFFDRITNTCFSAFSSTSGSILAHFWLHFSTFLTTLGVPGRPRDAFWAPLGTENRKAPKKHQ